MLKKKRRQQQEAVIRIQKMNDFKKEKEMIKILLKKIFETLAKSLDRLAVLSNGSNKIKMEKESLNGEFILTKKTCDM
jgi:hypothetical protein